LRVIRSPAQGTGKRERDPGFFLLAHFSRNNFVLSDVKCSLSLRFACFDLQAGKSKQRIFNTLQRNATIRQIDAFPETSQPVKITAPGKARKGTRLSATNHLESERCKECKEWKGREFCRAISLPSEYVTSYI